MGFLSDIVKGITDFFGDIIGFLIGVDFDDFEDQAKGALVNKQSNVAPIPVIYGQRKVGGVRVFVQTGGNKNKYLYLCLAICEGEIEEIGSIFVNDRLLSTTTNGSVLTTQQSSFYKDKIKIQKFYGKDTGQVNGASHTYSTLLAEATGWTSAHKLKGVAYLAMRFEYDDDIFGGIPDVQCIVKGRKLYDPRTSTTAYSTNPALCLRDYLTNERYGKGLPSSAIDDSTGDAGFQTAATTCDSSVLWEVYPYALAPSVTFLQACNYRLDTSKEIFNNVKEMLQGMRGLLPYTQGKYGLLIDVAQTTTGLFELNTDNITSDITVQQVGKGKRYNRVIATFTNPNANWQADTVMFPEKSTASDSDFVTFLAEDNDEELVKEIKLNTVTNLYQARELARIVCLASRKNQNLVKITATSEALELSVGDLVSVNHPSMGWTDSSKQNMRVTNIQLKENGEVGLSLVEYNGSIYPFAQGSEAVDNEDPNLPDPFSIEDPENLALVENTLISGDGSLRPAISATWDEAPDIFVREYEVQYKKSTSNDYQSARTGETRMDIFGVEVNYSSPVTYDVRVRAINTLGVRSAFISDTIQIDGDDAAPADITLGAITGGIRSITCEWENPDDDDFAHTQVYVKTTNVTPAENDEPTARIDGEEYIFQQPSGTDGAVTRYFFLRPVDFSGNTGNFTGTSNNSGTSIQAASADIVDAVTDKIDEIISPIDYDVVGDGTNSDHAELQTAFNSTEIGTNGLVLDGGNKTYVITSDINATGAFLRLKNFKFKLGTSYGAQGRINCDAGSGTTKMTVELDNVVFDGGRGTFKTGNEPWESEPNSVVNAGSFVTGTEYYITEVGTTDFTAIGATANTVNTKFTATGAGSGTGKAATTFLNYATIQPELSAAFKVNADNVDTEVRITNCRFENIHALSAIRIDSRGTNIIQDCVFKNMSFNSVQVFHSKDGGTTQGGRTLISDVYTEDVGLLPDTFNVNGASMSFSTTTASPQGSFNLVVSFGEYNITNASVKNYASAGVTGDRNKIFNASNITITNDSTRSFSNNPSGAFWLEDCELANVSNLHVDVTARSAKDTLADGFGFDNSLLQVYLTDGTKAFFNNVFLRTSSTTAYFNKLIRGSGQHEFNCNIQNFHVEGICRNLDDAVSFLLLPNSRVEQDIRLAHGYIKHGDIKIDNPHHVTIDDVYLEGGYDSTIAATAMVANTLYEIVSIGTTDFTAVGAPSNTVGLRFKPSGSTTGTGTVSLVYGNVVIFRAANADVGNSQIPDETHDFNVTNSYIYGDITNNTAITGTLGITNNKRIGFITSTSANNSGQTTISHNGLITGAVQITSDGADGTAKVEIVNNPLIQNLVLVDTTNTAVISNNVTNRRIEIKDVQNFQVVGNTAKTDRSEPSIYINPFNTANILSGTITGNNCLMQGATLTAGAFIIGTTYQIVSLGNTVWTDIGYDDQEGTDPAAVGDTFTATGSGSGTGTAKPIAGGGVSVKNAVVNVMEGLNNELTVNWS